MKLSTNKSSYFCIFLFGFLTYDSLAAGIHVKKGSGISHIQSAIHMASPGDTVFVHEGLYMDGNIIIDKALTFIGINHPILDGGKKNEVLSIKSDDVVMRGFRVQRSGRASLDDPGAIKVYESKNILIENNVLYDNFFGIYIQYSSNVQIKNNTIHALGKDEQSIGNGIHCWKSDSLLIVGNRISGHRDGIYFEFVTNSVIWRNISSRNIRYGLHFMFSNNDSYYSNVFKNNGAGVAVMFTHKVKMMNNTFLDNWGDASYGLLLKEISDSYIIGNHFTGNTVAVLMEGTNRILIEKNSIQRNGWGIKIQASCMDNTIAKNNFQENTFDVSTNGSLVLNEFKANYWDRYAGYDLDKNNIGDVAYHPLSLFAVMVEQNPTLMILFQSFIVTLIDASEKVLPSLTPDNFVDLEPKMLPYEYH